MKPNSMDERNLAEQAQEWLRHTSETEDAAFAAWLKRSPQHVQSYLQMLATEREFHGIDPQHEIDVDSLIVKAQSNVVPLKSGSEWLAARTPPRAWMRVAAATVILLGTSLCAWLAFDRLGTQTFRTATGQQQKIKLADGSIVELNTESRLEARYTGQGRDIYLLAGEALFDVKHGARPFRVHVDDLVIEDIGTQFNVYRNARQTTVSVIEGEVKVLRFAASQAAPVHILAGEEARIGARSPSIQRQKTDVARAIAWRQRRLWFQSATLGEITDEFNRYNTAPKILLEEASLRSRRFSGVFNADDPESFVQFLYQDAALDFDYDPRGFVVRVR